MEVEVRLTRTGEEPWGFRLIGGTDFNMPLTVVKVLPDSPADLAGIRNGDTVASIQGENAGTMTHDGAKAAVAGAVDSLSLGVMRGLYDLTIDDYDPIDDPLDQDDFDQPSDPTEVFQIQQFGDTPLDSKDPSRSRTGSRGNLDRRSLSEGRNLDFNDQRSLTESPYFLNTKPYRPFSTEPSPLPPLEKPIILNPNYHDAFGTFDDGPDPAFDLPKVDEFAGILSEKSRYKLPISKQYDPDGTRLRKTKEVTTVTKTVEEKIVTEEIVTKETKITSIEERLIDQNEETKFMEKNKKDIDLDKIEMCATSIVDESIQRAVTVADEIKKEIDLELGTITSESKALNSEMETIVMKTEKKESTKEVSEKSEIIQETNDVVTKKSDVSVAKEVAKFQRDDKQIIMDERQEFRKQEIEETIESGSVRRKSEMYQHDGKIADVKIEKKSIDETIESGSVRRKSEMYDNDVKKVDVKVEKISVDEIIESGNVRRKSEMYATDSKKADAKVDRKNIDDALETGSVRRKSEMYDKNVELKSGDDTKVEKDIKVVQSGQRKQTSQIKSEKVSSTTESRHTSDESKTKEAKYSTAKLLAEQRAYTIGLQTIPHIRGTVQSNYHYDLLLKTFFIHLTDVMVALSRFILAEPVLSKPLETKTESKNEVTLVNKDIVFDTTVVKDTVIDHNKTERTELKDVKITDRKEKVEDVIKQDNFREVKQQEYIDHVEKITLDSEKREKTVLSGAEMAQLSEKKSGELITKMDGVITEFQTKAGLEEEITLQRERKSRSRSVVDDNVVPQTTTSRVDKKSQEVTEVKTTSSILESTEMKTETKHESMDFKKETKHETKGVSNKDGNNTYISICEAHVYTNKNLVDEIVEISESASVESVKETNIALEANEAMVTERVALESKSEIKQTAEKSVEFHEIASAKTEEIVVQEKKDIIQELDVQKSSVEIKREKSAEVEIVQTIEPIVELHEDIVEKAISIKTKNKMDIQEIETSEYVEEFKAVKDETIQIVETQDIQEVNKVDIQIVDKAEKVEITDISFKAEEDLSIKKEEVKLLQEEIVTVKEEAIAVEDVKEIITIEKENIKESQLVSLKEEVAEVVQGVKFEDNKVSEAMTVQDEYANLKVTKEEITELEENIEINQEIEVNIKKSVHIVESENQYQSFISESSIHNEEFIQEASFIAKSTEDSSFTASTVQETSFVARSTEDAKKQLTLDLNSKLKKFDSQSSVKSTISTPTPSTVPPTPLTDEYVFRLQMPLPKLTGPPVPRSPSPEDEDPHIVKKNLVPHIDTEIIEEVVYETPLPTPPEDKSSPPKFTKPGLKGGNMKYVFYKEEIKEIERKSSLLASAIDQTIKSIEEYKEEVGIENTPVVYNGYAKVIDTKVYKEKLDEVNIEKQIVKNTEKINKIVEERVNSTEDSINRVALNGKPVTVTVTVENSVANPMTEASDSKMDESIENVCLEGYRPVPFNPEDAPHLERVEIRIPGPTPTLDPGKAFVTENGEIMGTHQGIVDSLEETVVNEEIANELGKPGMTEEKIAAIISGESEMLREAHVMGLTRVLKSHMHRDNDDSSVDFKKIKPIVESLKDSEVLKALNEEFVKTQEDKKKEERKWTKFLQKPARPVPKAKFGYHGWTANDDEVKESPYKVKIVKQPKPKVAPDYKPQDFNTGPLPWEERAQNEPPPPPVEAEPPILIPEEKPVFLEAIDNLPETAVPDLEETGIELPPEKPVEESQPETATEEPENRTEVEGEEESKKEEPKKEEPVVKETNNSESDMENRIAEQLMKNVEGMVDPNAPLEQQLAQMRAQLAALAQLPGVIQQTLELVTRQLCQITQQEAQSHQTMTQNQMAIESSEMVEECNDTSETIIEDVTEETKDDTQIEEVTENVIKEEITQTKTMEEVKQTKTVEEIKKVQVTSVEMEKMKREEQEILEEQRRIEKQKKELDQLDQEYEEMLQETPHEIALRFINELMGSLMLEKEPRNMKRPSLSTPNGPKSDVKEKAMTVPQRSQESKDVNQKSAASNGSKIGENQELMADLQLDQAARQLKQRPTPRVGKPKPVFGPLTPSERPVVLPGGRKWRKPKDAYNDSFIAETLTAQAELIQGKALGNAYESVHLPYDERVNFMKYEKPPITTDHLKNSEVYKLIHGMEQEPVKRVELLTPVISEADYRELPTKLEYLKDSEVYKMIHEEEKEPLRGVKMLQYIIAETRYQEKCRSVTPSVDMGR